MIPALIAPKTFKYLKDLVKRFSKDAEVWTGLNPKYVNHELFMVEAILKEDLMTQNLHISCGDGHLVKVGEPVQFVYYRQATKERDPQWEEGILFWPPRTNHNGRLEFPILKKGGAVLHWILQEDIKPLEKNDKPEPL